MQSGINFTEGDSRKKHSSAEVFVEDSDLEHVVTKSETCWVESYNSVLRYYLARLHRLANATKCYSKSKEMLRLSITLLAYEKFNLIGQSQTSCCT
jgi:IS1 family transposase